MNLHQWPDEERAAYETALSEATTRAESTGDRIAYLRNLLHEAAADGHQWALWALEQAERDGLNRQITDFMQREKRQFVTDAYGTIASKPKVGGSRKRNADGKVVHQQSLFEFKTLAELIIARDTYRRDRHGLTERITYADRLVSLCEAGNEALDIAESDPAFTDMTPHQAAEVLDTTVEDWLLTKPAL